MLIFNGSASSRKQRLGSRQTPGQLAVSVHFYTRPASAGSVSQHSNTRSQHKMENGPILSVMSLTRILDASCGRPLQSLYFSLFVCWAPHTA